jgi:hypothetical protein
MRVNMQPAATPTELMGCGAQLSGALGFQLQRRGGRDLFSLPARQLCRSPGATMPGFPQAHHADQNPRAQAVRTIRALCQR